MTTIAKPMTPDAATLRDVAIALGVDPGGDVLGVARQAAAAAREVDTALLVLAAVDEPAEPLVAAVRRLLRERDEALSVRDGYVAAVRERDEARASLLRIAQHIGFVDGDGTEERIIGAIDRLAGVRDAIGEQDVRGFDRAIRAVERALDGQRVDTGRRDADLALERVARLAVETERPSTQAPERAAILAGIDALGSSPADVEARNAARDAVRALGGEAPAAVLSAAELEAERDAAHDCIVEMQTTIARLGQSADMAHQRGVELEAERFAIAEAAGMVIQAEGHNPVAAPTENVIAAIKEAVDAVDTLCELQVLLDPHRIDTEMQYRDGTLEHGSYPEWETDYQVVRRLLAERDDRGEAIGEAYRDGARSMRERAAAHLDMLAGCASLLMSPQQTRREAAASIRALPLDDDAREDEAAGPYPCPGCQAFPGEAHPPYCPDAAMEREDAQGGDDA